MALAHTACAPLHGTMEEDVLHRYTLSLLRRSAIGIPNRIADQSLAYNITYSSWIVDQPRRP